MTRKRPGESLGEYRWFDDAREISAQGRTNPLAWLLIRAMLGQTSEGFSAEESLATACLRLHSRDAADRQAWIDLNTRAVPSVA